MAYLGLPLAGPRLLPGSSLPFPITLLWALLWALASMGLPWALPGPHFFPSSSLPFSLALLWAVASLGLPWALPALSFSWLFLPRGSSLLGYSGPSASQPA